MIEIERPGEYRQCRCCYSKDKVLSITFKANGNGTEVALCQKCQTELIEKLEEMNKGN